MLLVFDWNPGTAVLSVALDQVAPPFAVKWTSPCPPITPRWLMSTGLASTACGPERSKNPAGKEPLPAWPMTVHERPPSTVLYTCCADEVKKTLPLGSAAALGVAIDV